MSQQLLDDVWMWCRQVDVEALDVVWILESGRSQEANSTLHMQVPILTCMLRSHVGVSVSVSVNLCQVLGTNACDGNTSRDDSAFQTIIE
ncbi:uncharacterized protein MYCFIDRAFT_172697 [Pseudocercospora fijiensis CIRAD86]|uniref:Uncharacterized protein n=1 Tax=Pseudocercospora fijiensis (strain CIRAD86) TaxID=383855 RepID=M3A7F9_PSEFD|nr:uncharacterized protein MYCFIDRAFT_172697 [Pseudocercospora fijiensis CIRAD86]EME87024.1 hypothetical protein MYCFIDRAFT_172697 [Pseudocercospora fijiensis CIRAD86]